MIERGRSAVNGICFHTVAIRLDQKQQKVVRDWWRRCESSARSLAGAFVLAMSCSVPGAPAGAVDAPPNAHPEQFGSGWECHQGYQEDSGTCVAIEIPANAYLDPSGDHWDCQRGFRRQGDACAAIDVPANAFLTDTLYGEGWECERGHREQGTENWRRFVRESSCRRTRMSTTRATTGSAIAGISGKRTVACSRERPSRASRRQSWRRQPV